MKNIRENSEEVEKRLGYVFLDKELLVLAFTHRSYFNENQGSVMGHNERLEFLGDSVLGLIVSGYLYENLPQESEGHLSHLRAHLVGAEMCIEYLKIWDVEGFLLLGKGEAGNVGRGRDRIVADLFEALIGAIYIDGGIDAARQCFLDHFSQVIDHEMKTPSRNWKADLQDYAQKRYQKPPDYVVTKESGPPHSRTFVVAAVIDGTIWGEGTGASKKEAEQEAAEDALRKIEEKDGEG